MNGDQTRQHHLQFDGQLDGGRRHRPRCRGRLERCKFRRQRGRKRHDPEGVQPRPQRLGRVEDSTPGSDTAGTFTYTFTGGVSGSYGLTVQNSGGDENLSFSGTALDFTGPLTHSGTGTGTLTIGPTANIGTSVTAVIQDSATSLMVLNGAKTYTGPTTITSGTLSLGASASLASTTISVASGARFDVASVTGGYTLGSGQTLGGRGTIAGSGSFAAGSFLTLTRDCLTGKPCRGRPAGSRAMRPGSTR